MAGKEYTIVVLSSSPPVPDAFNTPHYAAPTRRVAMPPSSPFALSPPSSPKRLASNVLTSGSRAAPIPEKAARGFATVSSLVRSEHFAHHIGENSAEIQQVQQRQEPHEGIDKGVASAKRPTKRATKNATVADGEKPKPKPRARKPKADKEIENYKTALDPELRLPPRTTRSPFFDHAEVQTTVDMPTESAADAPKLTKSGKPRKPRAKKEKPESSVTGPKPKRTRITKAKATAEADTATREAADEVPAHIAVDKDQANTIEQNSKSANEEQHQGACIWDVPQSPQSEQNAHKQQHPDVQVEDLDLGKAVSRRRNWTPPKETFAPSPSAIPIGKENRPSAHDGENGNFTHLISNFTYESPIGKAMTNAIPTTVTSGITKRRRVELVELPGVQTTPRTVSPEKGKAPKKKPRTITDLVTGQYASKDTNAEAQAITSDFFSPRTRTTEGPLNDVSAPSVEAMQEKPSRRRPKARDGSEAATTKSKPRARKALSKPAAKLKPVAENLLSPTSAITRMNRQEVLFGTSSQLALEESPTTVRQIQQAIKKSEQDEGGLVNYSAEPPPRWPKLQRIEGKRGLWRESTRDSDGGLLENTENVYIPAPDRTQDLPLLMDIAREEPSLPSESVNIDDIAPPAPTVISSDLPTPPESQTKKHLGKLMAEKLLSDDVFDDIDDFDSDLPPSNQNAESQNSFADIDDFLSAPLDLSFQALPSISKSPASAPVTAAAADSSIKRRGRPSKVKSATPVIPASAPPPARKPSPLRQTSHRLPSTPPKGSGRFIDIEEILDSEDEVLEALSPTPPRVRKLQDSPPLPLVFDRETSASIKDQAGEPTITPVLRIQISLLEWAKVKPSICAAITAHVRSIPPTTDPKKPSWHEKILMYDPIILEDFTAYLNSNTKLRTYKRATQKQIKAYNSHLKMRGNAILGVETNDQALVIEKELEVYMVRDWCQEMSVCCIHAKESRGRGSARKGFY